jgi:hypothetical protein
MWQDGTYNLNISKMSKNSITLTGVEPIIRQLIAEYGGVGGVKGDVLQIMYVIKDEEDIANLAYMLDVAEVELNKRILKGNYEPFSMRYKSIALNFTFMDGMEQWQSIFSLKN